MTNGDVASMDRRRIRCGTTGGPAVRTAAVALLALFLSACGGVAALGVAALVLICRPSPTTSIPVDGVVPAH